VPFNTLINGAVNSLIVVTSTRQEGKERNINPMNGIQATVNGERHREQQSAMHATELSKAE
jgi:hypothetical protein